MFSRKENKKVVVIKADEASDFKILEKIKRRLRDMRKQTKQRCIFKSIFIFIGIMWVEHMTFCTQNRHAANCAIFRILND